jgi:signal transduction histidine kinase
MVARSDDLAFAGPLPHHGSAHTRLELQLAVTAHELRGPLLAAKAAIEAFLAMDTGFVVPAERRGEGADYGLLHRSVEQLGDLAGCVEDLLGVAGEGPPHLIDTDLVAMVRRAIASTTTPAQSGRVVLSGPQRLIVQASPVHLRSAISNLVRNALSYSPPHAKVSVTVAKRGQVAVVSVRDRGPGIPPAEQAAIFDPRTRGSAGRSRAEGHGLGLFIARRIVEAHAGRIMLESVGEGAVFRIELPLLGTELPSRNTSDTPSSFGVRERKRRWFDQAIQRFLMPGSPRLRPLRQVAIGA